MTTRTLEKPARVPAEAAAGPASELEPVDSAIALTAAQVLDGGEVVVLLVKPSIWFIAFQSVSVIVVTLICAMGLPMLSHRLSLRLDYDLASLIVAGRLMLATVQWMARIYILTDRRILRLSGVFTTEVVECPLRKAAPPRLYRPAWERLAGVGSIEIDSRDEGKPPVYWQTVARPVEIHQQIAAAITRSQSNGQCH